MVTIIASILFLFLLLLHYSPLYRFRIISTLLVSLLFYYFVGGGALLIVLLYVIFVSYYFGHKIGSLNNDQKKQKIYLVLSLILIITPLILFKYSADYFSHLNFILLSKEYLKIGQVIGLSFYTFQAISYLVDIYLEEIKAEKNLSLFALYLSYFPKILVGPIERANDLIPQFKKRENLNYLFSDELNTLIKNFRIGFIFIMWGAFKKLVIADRLGLFVDEFYNNYSLYPGIISIVPILFYSIQIYCDFSGYTDVAIGISKMFGIDLTQNFNTPYFATSIADFWRRWHISLSKCLMDYLFRPLSFSLRRKNRDFSINFSILITFLLCGIWHGSTITFAFWGFLNGLYMVISNFLEKIGIHDKKIKSLVPIKSEFVLQLLLFKNRLITFILISIAWIFFRSESLAQAFEILKNIFVRNSNLLINQDSIYLFKQSSYDFYVSFIGIIILISIDIFKVKGKSIESIFHLPRLCRWFLYSILLFSVLFFAISSETKFIYFEF